MPRLWTLPPLFLLLLTTNHGIQAQTLPDIPSIEIRSASESLLGTGGAASEGLIFTQRLAAMPLLRPGELLEMVPGLIVTQHAGDGKANQYFLRGFNLDHGTDFATYLDGMPLNMPSHAHGQGYTDLNFLIPELIETIHYRKGPYSAEEGDFSSAGVARMHSMRTLEKSITQYTLGPGGYQRGLLAGSPAMGTGRLLYGLEFLNNQGPWLVPENNRKLNAMLRYSEGSKNNGFSVSGMAYNNRWTSTDQIPQRAIDRGLISRFGSLDPTAGGITSRFSLSGEWAAKTSTSQSRANVWLLQSSLDLWSNFAYCLADLEANNNCNTGDQFKQTERRLAGGFAASHTVLSTWGQRDLIHTFGVQGRQDTLSPVGLFNTRQREIWNTVRQDRLQQRSLSVWAQTEIRWTDNLRTISGLRGDSFDFRVNSSLPVNSGHQTAQLVTPKLALIWRPAKSSELYLNYGQGFHSNDARGTTIRVDPNDPSQSVSPVPGLVRTRGQEIGLRSDVLPGWQSTLALWQLDSASELLFVGDAGTTEASRPSRRYGVEWSHVLKVNRHWGLDADFAWSHARFKDFAPEGNLIPGAIATTANLGLRYESASPWSGALRLRYLGPRPLTEDATVHSAASWLLNLRMGYKVSPRTQWSLDVYNLLNSKVNDIEYWYASQMRAETQAVLDRHIHPAEPRVARLTVTHRFE